MIKHLNVNNKAIKVPGIKQWGNREQESTAKHEGESSCDKEKPNTFHYIIIKPFCIAKTIINNMTNICNICDT